MHLWIPVWACVVVLSSAAPAKLDADVLADLKEILDEKLNQREARQQDEIISDLNIRRQDRRTGSTAPKKDVKAGEADDILTDHGWTQEEVETILERLPENDVRIVKEFAKFAARLNTARRLVLELNQLQAKPKRTQDHQISGFDPKHVGTREQDMKADDKLAPKQKPSKDSDSLGTDVVETDDDAGQWLNHPFSKDQIDRALSLLKARNNQRKRQDAASAVSEPARREEPKKGEKPSAKEMENAVLTALLEMREKMSDKSQ
ncbi:uncharacterized protein LOC135497904 isoform X1 [Lineus longissimus]|uniref:uncharacterized protein LOC135497904 isoform X1 n=1 Tax=Lineus longissimus TaxID=88925 RepID=UPI002B4E7DA3